MPSRPIRIGLLAIVAFAAGMFLARALLPGRAAPPTLEQATLLTTPRALPSLALVDQDGRTFGSDYFHGHWTLVFFGFTHCPDICPTTLALLARATQQLADLPTERRPRVLFISVDPERDTAARAGEYARFFDPAFLGASGSPGAVAAAAAAFSVPYSKVALADGGYTMDHSSAVILVDPRGRLAALMSAPRDAQVLARDYRRIVNYADPAS